MLWQPSVTGSHVAVVARSVAPVDLAFDYHTNLALDPTWQEWLRRHQPPTLITWGTGDPFFTAAGARVDLADVPDADLHLFDTGHFALEEKLPRSPPDCRLSDHT